MTTPANANHTGGTATCQAKAVCAVCYSEYGDYSAHNYDETTWSYKDANGHAYVCSVEGCNEHGTIVNHTSGGPATETVAEKCTVCEYVINPALGHKTHTPENAWSNNTTHHWHECVGCEDQEFNKAEHAYDNSCDTTCDVCGYKRAVTHSYTVLKQDTNNHWYECAICHAANPNSTEAHKGGTATCQQTAKCSLCGKEYGNLGSHVPNTDDGDCTTAITCSLCGQVTTTAKTHAFDNACDTNCNNANCQYTRVTSHVPNADDGDCTTAITCSVCGEVTTPAKESHTGGTATCKDKAECTVCGKEYGNFAAHTPNADDGDCTTAITCSVCDEETTPAKATHTGGTATCQAKAVCSECNKEYGAIDPDNHADLSITGTFSECEGGTKNVRCKACKESWTETLTAKGHNYVGGVCTTCGNNKPTNDFVTEYKVNGDETVTVTVKLTGVVKVAGFNITINYDPNVLYLESTRQGAFAVTENKGAAGSVVVVHTNSSSTTSGGTVLTLTFAIDSFENTSISITVNEIKETWYDNSIHNTESSATGATIPLAQ